MKYKFNCGCEFNIIKKLTIGMPLLNFNYQKNINYDCPAVWDNFKNSINLGIFQMESNLGKRWLKEMKPTCIEHLAALTSILRPGCLNNLDNNGISVTKHYCDRKNGLEKTVQPIKALESILQDTYQLVIYQESMIKIGMDIAGFNASDADYYLRKSIGVKDAKLLFSCEQKFLEGCKNTKKVNEEEAKFIFNGIKSSARYAFNKSHAIAYSIRTYVEMYLKTHFPLAFYTSKLKSPRKSTTAEDNSNLIYEAKLFNIETKLPDLRHLRNEFYHDNKYIYFGLTNIRDLGDSTYIKLKEVYDKNPTMLNSFFDFIITCGRYLTDKVVTLLIESGSVDFFDIPRTEMLEEYKLLSMLTDTEKEKLWRYMDAEKAGVFNA